MTSGSPDRGMAALLAGLEAAASTALAEVLLDLSREFEERRDAPAADLMVWLAELYARIGRGASAGEADASMDDAADHAFDEAVMLRVAERLDRESAYLRGAALDPTDGIAFLAARSAEKLVELLRSDAGALEDGDE